jgi:hypothetical protein
VTFWHWFYLVSIYIATAFCMVSVVKIWIRKGWLKGILELLILVLFGVAYWLLESFALFTAPFYEYPPVFPDMVKLFDFNTVPWLPLPTIPLHPCNTRVTTEISLTVLLLETSMTYCLMWTARLLLRPHGWFNSTHATFVAPFLVGLMALALDAFLDPIAAQSFSCAPSTLIHPGMKFWNWFTDASMANFWYGVPMYNYGAWYSAPVILVTAVLLIRWLYELFQYLKGLFSGNPIPAPSIFNGLTQLAILLAFLALHLTSPGISPPYEQVTVMLLTIAVSLTIVVSRFGTYDRHNPYRFEFVAPLTIVFLMPVPMLFMSGTFHLAQEWVLVLAALLLAAVGIIFALSPYSGGWLLPSMAPKKPPVTQTPPKPPVPGPVQSP